MAGGREGHFQRECQCGKEHVRESPADHRVRLDPLDPSTARHAPQCEQRDITDPVLLKALLKVQEGTGGPYHWVTCGVCDTSWQVMHYDVESAG